MVVAGVNWIFSFVRRFIQKEDNYSAGSLDLPWRQRSQGQAAEGTQGSSEEQQHQEKHNADAQAGARPSALHRESQHQPRNYFRRGKGDRLIMKGNNQI